MFRSEDQIEFFVSDNIEGRTLNFPLSLEMKECNREHNKLYYILNYNEPEELRTLHLDMIFGSYKQARIANEIKNETWDDLVDSMTIIENYQVDLPKKSQHIDVIEIECISPLLINAYYSYDSYVYSNLRQGEIVVKNLLPNNELKVTIDPQEGEESFFYSISLYNHFEVPSVTVRFSDGTENNISGNSVKEGLLINIPKNVTFINNVKTNTRIIFKVGLNIENGKNWKRETIDLDGQLFFSGNKFVYKFPVNNNKRDYTKIDFLVNGITTDVQNVKFCYSTNLGVALEASKENCFRTGRYISYTLSFINPLIVSKDYETAIDKYYISFRPYLDYEYITLTIKENKYESQNRNEEGKAKLITLNNKSANTILSLPQLHTTQILVQIRSCTNSDLPLRYNAYDALYKDLLYEGKTYYKLDIGYGIIWPNYNSWVETELKLEKDEAESETVKAFVKHAAIGSYKVNIQKNYTDILFDETKNTVTIKKPILNEEFIMTIIVDKKEKLGKYTQCDLAFDDKRIIGIYQMRFISLASNTITHFIDFSVIGFEVGTEFDLLVYAEQTNNSKMEFLYPLFQGKVGELSGVEEIKEYIENDEYVTLNFKYNPQSNYLYYDFPKNPYGNIASLKITSPDVKISKISCVFVSNNSSNSSMIIEVNNAMLLNKNNCINLGSNNTNVFNALVNAKFELNYNRLVMQVLYNVDNDNKKNNNGLEEQVNTINIKIEGKKFGNCTGKQIIDEKLTPIPFVIDLEEIRNKTIGSSYVSKLLLYSNTTKMTMYYISNSSLFPLTLFEGNIMLIYTNPDLIYQKYKNAKQMILTTDTNGQQLNIIDVQYLDSAAKIQYYYLGSEAKGRVLNTPNTIEMTSCDLPFYYILNYNKVETGKRILYIDNIFGEIDTMKIATSLDYNSWNELLDNMHEIDTQQIILPEERYPFDIIEVKCKLPLLLNLFYADPDSIKTEGLEIGDIIIFSLKGNSEKMFKIKSGQERSFIYYFNILQENNSKPNIEILFDGESDIIATENGLYIKDTWMNFENIKIINSNKHTDIDTRIIIKLGYAIESCFTPLENGVYHNKDMKGRTLNLYGYKYKTTSDRLNYTGVDFEISTTEDNVKFCYNTNLGLYINPSLLNCFRVGKNNPYTISTRSPFIMYRNYYTDMAFKYYIGFRTNELYQNITINPKLMTYDTTERNIEGINKKIKMEGDSYSTILTAPSNHNKYVFTYISICTKGENLSYEYYNAYNDSNLGYNGYINSEPGYGLESVPNTKLDTELKLKGKKDLEVFVKHIGLDSIYQPNIEDIIFSYDKDEKKLEWTQPIKNEEFRYDIYIDKINNIKDKGYTLCSVVDTTKLGRFHDSITTNNTNPSYIIDFSKPDLVDITDFDAIIVAQQINKGKLIFLSPVYSSKEESHEESEESESPEEDEEYEGSEKSEKSEEYEESEESEESKESEKSDTKPGKPDDSNKRNLVGIIVGSVLGGLVLIGLIVFFVVRYYRKKKVNINDVNLSREMIIANSVNE